MTQAMTEDERLNAEAILWGQALRALRLRSGKTQSEAADLIDRSHQVWAYWETAKRVKSFLRMETQREAAEALGFNWAQLAAAKDAIERGEAQISIDPIHAPGATFRIPVTGDTREGPAGYGVYESDASMALDIQRYVDENTRVLPVATEDAAPFAEPGGFVTYSVKGPPLKGRGVVIKMRGGPFLIRRYVRQLAAQVECLRFETRVLDTNETAYVEKTEFIPNHDVEKIYPIIFQSSMSL